MGCRSVRYEQRRSPLWYGHPICNPWEDEATIYLSQIDVRLRFASCESFVRMCNYYNVAPTQFLPMLCECGSILGSFVSIGVGYIYSPYLEPFFLFSPTPLEFFFFQTVFPKLKDWNARRLRWDNCS